MEFPVVILLFPYIAIVLVVFVFSFFHLYHAFRFGMHSPTAYAVSAVYIAAVIIILGVTWLGVRFVDWMTPITIELPTVGVEVAP